jgi:hypothetical protein
VFRTCFVTVRVTGICVSTMTETRHMTGHMFTMYHKLSMLGGEEARMKRWLCGRHAASHMIA